jgi:hypothetical protein
LDSSTRWKRSCASKRLDRTAAGDAGLAKQPGIERLHRAMELVTEKTLPQGLLGQAIDYTLKRWEALTGSWTTGRLEIDNNLIENAIRPSALGKKNWLFWASRSWRTQRGDLHPAGQLPAARDQSV